MQAMEREVVLERFNSVYEKMNQALDGMPYKKLDISVEVKEQAELMCEQLRRTTKRTDTQDVELAMDMMIVFDKKDDRSADSAILQRLAQRLELDSLQDLRKETMAIKRLIQERQGQFPETSQKIIELLKRFKKISGIEDMNGIDEVSIPKYLEKCPSLIIPNDFLCPLSLEIMIDPVIVASGQTFERRSIEKWIEAGHRTCPKTGQPLEHLSLAPNYALQNLIKKWCERNKVSLARKEASSSTSAGCGREGITSLVHDLNSSQLDVQRKAVSKIRMMSKENPENRISIANSGGIPFLVKLLAYPDHKIQENTVTALMNLSIDEFNKKLIAKENAIPLIIEILKSGSVEGKENSAATLFSLSMLDENKVSIGMYNGIPALVDLLKTGTMRGKKDAAIALFNLLLNQPNRKRAIDAGIVTPLLKVLGDKKLGMVDEALSIILLLTSVPDGVAEVGNVTFVERLVEFIRDGTPKNKECAVSVLLELGLHDTSLVLAAVRLGVYEELCEISKTGTSRAQRKTNSLLHHIAHCDQ